MAKQMLLIKPKSKVRCASHYWMVEEAGGPTSKAICKYCGRIANFKNALTQFHSWWDMRTLHYEKNQLEFYMNGTKTKDPNRPRLYYDNL